MVETIQQNLITSGIFQTSVNCLNRLTAPNLDLTRSQESYKSYSWRKNIFGVTGGDPFQFHIRKKKYPPVTGTVVDIIKGRGRSRSMGVGMGKVYGRNQDMGDCREDYGYL